MKTHGWKTVPYFSVSNKRQKSSIKISLAFDRHETLMLIGNQGLKKANNILLKSLSFWKM